MNSQNVSLPAIIRFISGFHIIQNKEEHNGSYNPNVCVITTST